MLLQAAPSQSSPLHSALVTALIATLVSILANIALYWRRRKDDAFDYTKRRIDAARDAKHAVLEALLGNRFNKNRDEFLEALNKAAIMFYDADDVKGALKRYQEYRQQADYDSDETDFRFVEVVKAMTRNLNISLEPLNDEFFLKPFVADEPFEPNERQLSVFTTLMATRGSLLSADNVRALNLIDLVFYGGDEEEKRVRESWKAYLHHLNDLLFRNRDPNGWDLKRVALFSELLFDMSKCLGYDFDKTELSSSWYAPEAHGIVEQELTTIRKGVAGLIQGTIPLKPIPVVIERKPQEPAKIVNPSG